MAQTGTAEIRINKRTVRIGHEVYPLANISRLQTVQLHYGKKKSTFQPVKEMAAVLVFAIAAAVAVTMSGIPQAEQIMRWIVIVTALCVAYLLIVFVHRMLRRPIYSLAIETAGTQFTLLSSHDLGTVRMIEREVVNAIENPPNYEKVFQVGDIILGDKIGRDKISQSGYGNTMNARA